MADVFSFHSYFGTNLTLYIFKNLDDRSFIALVGTNKYFRHLCTILVKSRFTKIVEADPYHMLVYYINNFRELFFKEKVDLETPNAYAYMSAKKQVLRRQWGKWRPSKDKTRDVVSDKVWTLRKYKKEKEKLKRNNIKLYMYFEAKFYRDRIAAHYIHLDTLKKEECSLTRQLKRKREQIDKWTFKFISF